MWNKLITFFTGNEITDSKKLVHIFKRIIWIFLWLGLIRYGIGIVFTLIQGDVTGALSLLIMPIVIIFLLLFITF